MQPTHIGKYRVVSLIGQGAMGEVYLAEDPHIARPVAIKVMKTTGDDDEQRFLHEARIAGSLSHPNIVIVHEFGFQDGRPFIVMEYVAGTSLEVWLREQHSFVEQLQVIEGLYDALRYAHQRGVLHRDLKPSNIQVMPDGRCKLMDFGIARLQASRLTATGKVLGTPAYMAPEILADAAYSPQADVYSSAVVVYEMLAGSNPFLGQTLAGTLTNVLSVRPAPLVTVRPDIPAELADAISRSLSRDPRERPQGLSTIVEIVGRLKASAGPNSTQPALPQVQVTRSLLDIPSARLRRRRRLARRALAAGASAVVLIVGGSLIRVARRVEPAPSPSATLWTAREASPSTSPPPPSAVHANPDEPASVAAPAVVRRRQAPRTVLPSSSPRESPQAAPEGETIAAPAAAKHEAIAPEVGSARAVPGEAAALSALPTDDAPGRNQPAPVIQSITPRSARRGSTLTFELRGAGFQGTHRGRVLRGRQEAHGIHVLRQQVLGPTLARITVLVDEDAPIGLFSLALVEGEGGSTNSISFEVIL